MKAKNRITAFILCVAMLASACLLQSCGDDYSEYRTDENRIGVVNLGGTKLAAYLFELEETGARIELVDQKKDKVVQVFELPKEGEYYTSLDFEYASEFAVFQDMNFDGYKDLYVPCSVTTANLEGMAWLWDADEETFVLSEELSELYELTVYPEDELITSQDYSDPAGILCKEFKWEEGKLVQTGEYTVSMGN